MYTNTLIHTMQKNKPSEKKIHTNRTLFSNLFFFFVLVKNEPNVIKNGFIHSETFENRKKENKRSDTQTQKYATTRTKWARGGKEKQRERARQVTVKKKKNLHTKFILRTQSNQNKKCIQPQKSCALLLLFLVPRCCFLTHRSLFASLEWNENCSKMVYYVKFGVLCSCVCLRARVSLLFRFTFAFCGYESVRWSNVWNFLFLAFWYCCSFFLFFSRSLNGKGGKIEHIHSTRQARRSFWNFIILIVSFLLWVCVCVPASFFSHLTLFHHRFSSNSYYYNYYDYYNLLHNPNRNVEF